VTQHLISRVMARALLVCVMLVLGFAAPLRAQSAKDLDALGKQSETLIGAGKYQEAIEVEGRAVALAERTFGADHIRTAYELYRLGHTMRLQSQFSAAHPQMLRALTIFEREAASRDNMDVARALNELGWTSLFTLHLQEAQQFFSRSLVMKERLLAPDDLDIAYALDGLAMTSVYASQYAAAAGFGERSLAIKRKRLDPTSNDITDTRALLATIKFKNGQMAEAGELFLSVLAAEKAKSRPDPLRIADVTSLLAVVNFDKDDYATAERQVRECIAVFEANGATERGNYYSSFNLLAKILTMTNRYAEAETAAQKVIQAYGSSTVVQPRDVMDATNTLSIIYNSHDRYADAEQALKKAVAIAEQTFGETSVDVAKLLENLAYVYATVGRQAEALELFKRILRIRQKVLPAGHPDIGSAYANRARVLNKLERYQEAEADAREAIRMLEAIYGAKNSVALSTRDELGTALRGQRRYEEALQVYKDAVAAARAAEGETSERIPVYLHNMGLVLYLAGRYTEAEDALKRSLVSKKQGSVSQAQTREVLAALYTKMSRYADARENFRLAMGAFVETFKQTAASRREYEGGIWLNLTASSYLAALLNSNDFTPAQRQSVGKEAFEVAQWLLRTTTSSTLSQVGARYAAGSDALAQSVRARQDSIQRWQALNAQLDSLISQPIGDRNQTHLAAAQSELATLETRLTELDQLLAEQFPAYVELSSPRPISSDAIQTMLRGDEALVQFAIVDQRVVVWVVTPSSVSWYPTSVSVELLSNTVAALRCGLDYQGSWAKSRCPELLKTTYSDADHDAGKPLPFDLAGAHSLYKDLFGEIEDLVKDKTLLIVPTGALTQLPFQVLVTEPPIMATGKSFADYRDVAWLARKHAIMVLPAASSLKPLRELAKASHASEAYIGFGNPLLDGEPDKFKEDGPAAKLAREKRCDPTLRQRLASLVGGHATRSGGALADFADIRRWAPLPETADELCDVAHDLGVDPRDHLYLGATATVIKIKTLSADGTLARYRVVHFATHGALAGQVAHEPGLLLTPPSVASQSDNGYLTASEISALKLDADWVILSACNTAAGGAEGAEALSGLARAFFYAGARSLLVSHWAVASNSTVNIITKAVEELRADPTIGRSEALRRSMLALITAGKNYETHPTYWAPFVLVGEGGAAR
jgi:CHAT domain-containing protein